MLKTIWDKTWRNQEGKVVIWQMPNAWLIGWAIFTFMALLVSGKTSDVLSWIGEASLVVWCLDEMLRGVNYFRRALGLVVLIYAVVTILRSF